MLKNVTLMPSEKDGKSTWYLLGPDGLRLWSFSTFADGLLPLKYNTRLSYCRHLAVFFDYFYEAVAVLDRLHGGLAPTRIQLKKILEAYAEFLVYGADSGNDIAVKVSHSLRSPRCSSYSAALMHAPVRSFLSKSEDIRKEVLEFQQLGLSLDSPVDSLPLFDELNSKVSVRPEQRAAMMANSMFAGVISGGPKLLKSTVLPTASSPTAYDDGRAFPFDAIAPFIEALPSMRERTRYSLMAASGGRPCECTQLLCEDVDVNVGTVVFINPANRANHPSYLQLKPMERDRLSWKGRNTERTLLIEPFVSMFFEYLEQYFLREYVPHGKHSFLFQHLDRDRLGQPYFLSAHSTRWEAFRRNAAAVNLPEIVKGPHGLRHSYATYLLNYFPRSNGTYGLPPPMVQQQLGHASATSTSRYARHDRDLMLLELKHANAMVFRGTTPRKLVELKLEALNAQVRQLEEEMGLLNHD